MNRNLIRLLAAVGWTLLVLVGVWALVTVFVGLPSLPQLNGAFGVLAVALVAIAGGQELERRANR